MLPLQTYVNQCNHTIRKITLDPRVQTAARAAACLLGGFCLSAASLTHRPLPLAMGLSCALGSWSGVLAALGGALGYRFFWADAGLQGMVWVLLALGPILLPRLLGQTPLLLSAVAGLITAACGVLFQQVDGVSPPIWFYLLRVALAMGSAWLFRMVVSGHHPIGEWFCWGIAVLSLAQIAPAPWLSLGYILAGALLTGGPFPAAALGGLALDLAQVTQVPMTAVMAMGFVLRFPPGKRWVLGLTAPGCFYVLVMLLCGRWDLTPVVGLTVGGLLGTLIPQKGRVAHRRGETGAAQVRLELAAGVLSQAQQLLAEFQNTPIDENALVLRAAERACGGCSCRKTCKDARRLGQLPGLLLQKPLLSQEELPIICRKSGRFLAELHRSQEQLRSIRADRERQGEYRAAITQQYRFLAQFLQDLSDRLIRRSEPTSAYAPRVNVYGNRPESDNGDRCLRFAGTGCRYYILLCDGMGTGPGAVREGKLAGDMLKRLLCAGFPPEHALKTLNSLCALRERAGAVTVDLCSLQLDTGRATLYKWGAAPSYLVSPSGARQVGTVTPPPGLSVLDSREQIEQVSLRRGEVLVLCSDGVAHEDTLRCCTEAAGQDPAMLGQRLLEHSRVTGDDDATAAIISLAQVR